MACFERLKYFLLGARPTLCEFFQCFVDNSVFLVPPHWFLCLRSFPGTCFVGGNAGVLRCWCERPWDADYSMLGNCARRFGRHRQHQESQVFAYLREGLSRIHALFFLPFVRQPEPLRNFVPERSDTLHETHRLILERAHGRVSAKPAVDDIVRLQHGQIVRQPPNPSLHAVVQGNDSPPYALLQFLPCLLALSFPRTVNLVQSRNFLVESTPDVLGPVFELGLWI